MSEDCRLLLSGFFRGWIAGSSPGTAVHGDAVPGTAVHGEEVMERGIFHSQSRVVVALKDVLLSDRVVKTGSLGILNLLQLKWTISRPPLIPNQVTSQL